MRRLGRHKGKEKGMADKQIELELTGAERWWLARLLGDTNGAPAPAQAAA